MQRVTCARDVFLLSSPLHSGVSVPQTASKTSDALPFFASDYFLLIDTVPKLYPNQLDGLSTQTYGLAQYSAAKLKIIDRPPPITP
jgi:hypothetical protein